jgi:hypothetical protein
MGGSTRDVTSRDSSKLKRKGRMAGCVDSVGRTGFLGQHHRGGNLFSDKMRTALIADMRQKQANDH